jgi:hypothetical protein
MTDIDANHLKSPDPYLGKEDHKSAARTNKVRARFLSKDRRLRLRKNDPTDFKDEKISTAKGFAARVKFSLTRLSAPS